MRSQSGIEILSIAVLLAFIPAIGNTWSKQESVVAGDPLSSPRSGVIVEHLTQNSAAAMAGIEEGDVLLGWTRDDAKGEIVSPFDISLSEIEQAPRGAVALSGLRGREKRIWTITSADWGLQTRPPLSPEILKLHRRGQELAKAGKTMEAAESWQRALLQVDPSAPARLSLWLLSQSAQAFAERRSWKETDAVYEDLTKRSEGAEPELKGQLQLMWADTFRERADWVNARRSYQAAADSSHGSGAESLLFADALDGVATSAVQRGDLLKGEEFCSYALAIQRRLAPGSLKPATSLNTLGNIARIRGDLAKAEDYYRQALAVREKLAPGSPDLARSLNNLGGVLWLQGDLEGAESHYLRAIAISKKLTPGSMDVASTLNNLGVVARNQGNLTKATEYYHQSLVIREKLVPGGMDVAGSLNNLGSVARDRGDLAKAEKYCRQALAIKQKVAPASLDVAGTLNNLGIIADEAGSLAKAEEYHRQALMIEEKVAPGSLIVGETLGNLGNVIRNRGDLAGAEEYYRRALDIEEKIAPGGPATGDTLGNLGQVVRDRGDLVKAEEYFRQSLGIWDKHAPQSSNRADTLAALAGIMVRTQQLDAAAGFFEQALNTLESQVTHLGGDQEIRSDYRARHTHYYQEYIDLLIRRKQPDHAFQVLERSRARTLLEMLEEAHIDVYKGVDSALHDRERSLQRLLTTKSNREIHLLNGRHTEEQLASTKKDIEELLDKYQVVKEEIRASSPNYAALTHAQPLDITGVQQRLLDPDTLLLEYFLGEEHSYVWAVTANSLASFELPKRAEIENSAHEIYALLRERGQRTGGESGIQRQARLRKIEAKYWNSAAAFSRMVLGPVAAQIRTPGKRLLIVSDGALRYIPFAALPEPGAMRRGQERVPLIAQHEVVYLPSVSVLEALRRAARARKEPPRAVAILADPVFSRDDPRVGSPSGEHPPGNSRTDEGRSATTEATDKNIFAEDGSTATLIAGDVMRSASDIGIVSRDGIALPRLPFSRQEAAAILQVAPHGRGLAALDFRASRAMATSDLLAQYRIVHFATHGLLNNQHSGLSGLVLSMVDNHGSPQNGFLALQDIYNLNLPVDLVVLSACETGLGKELQGEGMIGLTRGFMYAGASRVVASLWNVSDNASAELMARFYRAMFRQGLSPASALRQAQLQMWRHKRWSEPYYWAGFVMQGDWKPMAEAPSRHTAPFKPHTLESLVLKSHALKSDGLQSHGLESDDQ